MMCGRYWYSTSQSDTSDLHERSDTYSHDNARHNFMQDSDTAMQEYRGHIFTSVADTLAVHDKHSPV
jgi:hypothetical protein